MPHKFTFVSIFALSALLLTAAPVRHSKAQTTLGVSVECIPLSYGQLRCDTEVYGGTAPYSYEWGPPPLSGSGHALRVPCSGSGSRTISVTVTDANGDTGNYTGQVQCTGPV